MKTIQAPTVCTALYADKVGWAIPVTRVSVYDGGSMFLTEVTSMGPTAAIQIDHDAAIIASAHCSLVCCTELIWLLHFAFS